MINSFKKTFILSSILMLTACTFSNHNVIANRDTAYLSAKSVPPLQIPPGLASSTIQAEYPVSDRQYPESAKHVSLIPPDLRS